MTGNRQHASIEAAEATPANIDPCKVEDQQDQQERGVGITTLISPESPGFDCIFKQRYTDFQVNEILPSGEVLHLTQLVTAPARGGKHGKDESIDGKDNATKEPENIVGWKREVDEEDEVVETSSKKRVKLDGDIEMRMEQIAQQGGGSSSVDVAKILAGLDSAELMAVEEIFGPDTTREILELYTAILTHPQRKAKDHVAVKSSPIEVKSIRTKAHGAIRKLFDSKLETATLQDEPGRMSIRAAAPRYPQANGRAQGRKTNGQAQQRPRADWRELGGEYLHFTLYKSNKDTMEVLYFMASELKMKVSSFQFAGTKDRRGVTVQRIAVYRVLQERLIALTRIAKGWKIDGLQYKKHGIELGDLKGNEFVLTLREVTVPGVNAHTSSDISMIRSTVDRAARALATDGFINFYGLQRFGAFKTGTHITGMLMIQGDLEGAVNGILAYDEALVSGDNESLSDGKVPKDDIDRARAIHTWRTTSDINRFRQLLPRRFQAESNIVQGLSRKQNGKHLHEKDWQGALMTIQRGLRLMYVHAYQSFVWNTVASERWRLHGSRVVEGDLVIIESPEQSKLPPDTVDQDGEVVVHASESAEPGDLAEGDFVRARPLTKEQASSGEYSIYDIVLPLPGWDVIYPANDIGAFYESFMASKEGGQLDPRNMRRAWKDVSLSGGYRKLMARPLNGVDVEVRTYHGEEQLAPTDVDRLAGPLDNGQTHTDDDDDTTNGEQKFAAVMRFQLGSGQYATMALRELTKGGARAYRPEFAVVR